MRISNTNYNFDSCINSKIIHISDIHYCNDYKLKRLEMLFDNIKDKSPNYICITGDLIDSGDVNNDKLDIFVNWLDKLSKISKLMIVLGNHDVEIIKNKTRDYHVNKYFISRLKKLNNTYLLRNDLYKNGNITFIGLEIDYEYYKGNDIKIIDKINNITKYADNKINILLVHDPSPILDNKHVLNLEKIDFVLCGHTHGGLMPKFVPGDRGFISPEKWFFKKNMRGMHKIKNTTLIISTGIVKLSKRSHLTKINDIYSCDVVTINLKNNR